MKERSQRATIRNHQYFRCDFLRQSQTFDRQGTETRHGQGAVTEPSMYVEIHPASWFNMDLIHPRARRCLSELPEPCSPHIKPPVHPAWPISAQAGKRACHSDATYIDAEVVKLTTVRLFLAPFDPTGGTRSAG